MAKVGPIKKAFLIASILLIVLLLSLGGAVFYYYSHPSALKAFLEKGLSGSTGASVTIEKISYSINPLMIRAEGIHLTPGKDLKGLHLTLPDFRANLSFKGAFGRKSMIVENLEMDGLSLSISPELHLGRIDAGHARPSFTGRTFKKLVALFLFRNLEFKGLKMTNGLITARLKDRTVVLNRMCASLSPERRLEISLDALLTWPLKKMSVTAPNILISTDRVISFTVPHIAARLTIKNAAVESPDIRATEMALTADLRYDHAHGILSFDRADVRVQGVSLNRTSETRSTPLSGSIRTNGVLNLKEKRLNAQHVHLTIKDLLQLKGGLKARLGGQESLDAELLIEEIEKSRPAHEKGPQVIRFKNLAAFFRHDGRHATIGLHGKQVQLLESALAWNLLPPGWQCAGNDSFEITAGQKDGTGWSFTTRLNMQSTNFQNADATFMGEKLFASLKIDGLINLKTSTINADTSIEIKKGEVLYDRFYLNLDKNDITTSCTVTYHIPEKELRLPGLKLGIKDILSLKARGTVHHGGEDKRVRLDLTIPETPVKKVFEYFVLEPFRNEIPFLNTLTIGGNISALLGFEGNRKDMRVSGRCAWNGGEFSIKKKGLSCRGIELDLPVRYHSSVTGDESQTEKTGQNRTPSPHSSSLKETPAEGKLAIRSMTIPFLPEQSLAFPLKAGVNTLSVQEPTVLKVPGGTVELGPVTGKDIFSSRLFVDTSLSIKAVELEPVLEKILPQPVKGTIDGLLSPIHFTKGVLKTTGVITAKAFGGEIVLSDIGASGLFTPAPVYGLSALLTYLNLEEMTTGTAFGKIEGTLEGHVNNLEIAYGQPQKFELLLETVRTEGARQKISVRAVDNIARIGGGTSPFMGIVGGFTSFFKEFPYNKIGVSASLKNDVFRINGTIRKGNKEYLVERGSFSGVNIVNQNPDNRISFKDMVKRVKRVTSSEKGPVIR